MYSILQFQKKEPEVNGTPEEIVAKDRKASIVEEKSTVIEEKTKDVRKMSVKDEPKKIPKKPDDKKVQILIKHHTYVFFLYIKNQQIILV